MMETIEAIDGRRSIRRFQGPLLPRRTVETILEAAVAAPSGKNRQPWRFVVLTGSRKSELVAIMREGLDSLRERGLNSGSLAGSAAAVDEASTVVVVFNGEMSSGEDRTVQRHWWSVHTQSIGAAIQNMLLAAHSMGVGSLWICDVFFVEEEIRHWLNRDQELVAAVAFGYPAESPSARPRLSVDEVTEWLK